MAKLGSLTKLRNYITVLTNGQVLREYGRTEFELLQQDLLDQLHQEKLQSLEALLPIE